MNIHLKIVAMSLLSCASLKSMEKFPRNEKTIKEYLSYCKSPEYRQWVKENSYKPGDQENYTISAKFKAKINAIKSNQTSPCTHIRK